ncbi:MAG TPA: YcbK family protein [Accumulibacter sp.]|nr:YcbK family protein [Accumulibacter sp.]
MTPLCSFPRRHFIQRTGLWVLAGALAPVTASAHAAMLRKPRHLLLEHLHTEEQLSITYAIGNNYLPSALARLDHFLRDHYTQDVGHIDPALFDLLHQTQQLLGSQEPFQVISGYRCPATNDQLRENGGGGVARRSLHMLGRAIDIRLPETPLNELREAAISLKAGGVGFYPQEQFVHLDTGKVRYW